MEIVENAKVPIIVEVPEGSDVAGLPQFPSHGGKCVAVEVSGDGK